MTRYMYLELHTVAKGLFEIVTGHEADIRVQSDRAKLHEIVEFLELTIVDMH